MPTSPTDLPLTRRYPALRALPRAALCTLPTPVDSFRMASGRELLVKRDDLTATPLGGNKARGLEWLLGGVGEGDRVVTVGPIGSNSALATAVYARRLGATTTVVRWKQHLNPAAVAVDARIREVARVVDAGSVPVAYVVATIARLRQRALWVPAGAATPAAILGHVNAALELAEQVQARACETPSRVFVPLGTGGTAAGLALGFRIAGLGIPITAVRVVPRIVGRASRVASLANRAASLIETRSGEFVPRVPAEGIVVEHAFFGGEYGRPLAADEARAWALRAGLALDDTYSLKTCAAALASAEPRPLLWLTFDGRVLDWRGTSHSGAT